MNLGKSRPPKGARDRLGGRVRREREVGGRKYGRFTARSEGGELGEKQTSQGVGVREGLGGEG